MARATVTDVKIRFTGNKTDKPNSFCIFFEAKNENYVPFKLKESCAGRYYLIATCDEGLDEKFKTKSMEFDISCITIYGTEDDIHFHVVDEASQASIALEVISTYSSYFCMTVGGWICYLDPCTEIRINGLPLDLEKGNTTETAMKKLSKIFNNDKLKEISCIGYTTLPVFNGSSEWVKEINLDVPEPLRAGLFEQVISTGRGLDDMGIPNRIQTDMVERLKDLYSTTGMRFDHDKEVQNYVKNQLYIGNIETGEIKPFGEVKNFNPVQDLADRWINGAKWDPDSCKVYMSDKKEETTMIHKRKSLGIKNIVFNAPATIVFWDDGTKTVVKCGEGDVFDPEKGVAMAVMKRALGSNETDSNYLDKVKKYIDQYKE